MNVSFEQVHTATIEIVDALNRWENDDEIVHFIRPSKNKEELQSEKINTLESINERLGYINMYLIYADEKLIGEINYMIDPSHLLVKEEGTAWIGIVIGEEEGRGKGIGYLAMEYIEKQIKNAGIKRIELGVFEYNTKAHKLYQQLGYKEIGRIDNFTYWNGKLWSDIRMEKLL